MSLELVQWTRDLAQNHRIDFQKLLECVEEALAVSIRRKYDGERSFRVKLDPETGEQQIFRTWKVVEEVTAPTKEISLEAALLDDPNLNVGDYIEDLDEDEQIVHDRNSYISFRQMMQNGLRDLERDRIVSSYEPYIGTIVTGKIRKISNNLVVLNLPEMDVEGLTVATGDPDDQIFNHQNTVEGVIRRSGMIPGEKFRVNQEIKCFLVAIERAENKKVTIVLSRTHPEIIRQLMFFQIPELREGMVDIVKIVREAGKRAKVSVVALDPYVDVVGAFIGIRSMRIQAIIDELNGERVDIIPYHEDLAVYVGNALALNQEDIKHLVIDDRRRLIEVYVAEESLSGAIGRGGLNIRLATKLLDNRYTIRIYDIVDKDRIKEEFLTPYVTKLEADLGVDAESAQYLADNGFTSVEEIAGAEIFELYELLSEEQAQMIHDLARAKVEEKIQAERDFITSSNIEPALLNLEGINTDIIINLIKQDIKTLEDLADLATDELDGFMSRHLAESLIMQARQICWFSNADEEA